MSARVALPRTGRKTGCYGLEFPDGSKVSGRPGSTVTVDDHQAAQIAASSNSRLGLVSATMQTSLGTRSGRWCVPCRKLWQGWTTKCHKCGGPTVPEGSEDE